MQAKGFDSFLSAVVGYEASACMGGYTMGLQGVFVLSPISARACFGDPSPVPALSFAFGSKLRFDLERGSPSALA